MANRLAELKNALGAGARANKYRVNFAVPAAVPTTSNLQHVDALCKASNFPSMTIGQIEVFNQGRKLILPGDTTYTNAWTLTFYNTEDHALRKDMIAWMKAADHFQNNTHSGNPSALNYAIERYGLEKTVRDLNWRLNVKIASNSIDQPQFNKAKNQTIK
jgi:hypothetical protein